jgi:hypothetical protein
MDLNAIRTRISVVVDGVENPATTVGETKAFYQFQVVPCVLAVMGIFGWDILAVLIAGLAIFGFGKNRLSYASQLMLAFVVGLGSILIASYLGWQALVVALVLLGYFFKGDKFAAQLMESCPQLLKWTGVPVAIVALATLFF